MSYQVENVVVWPFGSAKLSIGFTPPRIIWYITIAILVEVAVTVEGKL
jgi:hypothetical protein